MAEIKQVTVVRKDTNPKMRKGKMCAQVGHAVSAFIDHRIKEFAHKPAPEITTPISGDHFLGSYMGFTVVQLDWIYSASKTKICLGVETEEELLDIYNKAKTAGLEVHLITDSGKTEFGEPTRTCLAIGPDYSERIDPITGHLKPL